MEFYYYCKRSIASSGSPDITDGHGLGRGDEHGPCYIGGGLSEALHDGDVLVGGPRRRVDDKRIQISPCDIFKVISKLAQKT